MHLVIHQVMQFEDVHVAHRHRTFEGFTRTTVDQFDLGTGRCQLQIAGNLVRIGQFEHRVEFGFCCTVKPRGGERYAAAQVVRQLHDFVIRQRLQFGSTATLVVDLVEELTHFLNVALGAQHFVNTTTQPHGCPAQMGFQYLTDVHTGRHTQRVEDDIHRTAIGHVRHIFHRHNARKDALVSVTAGHLVTRLQTTLDSQIDLDHLLYARRQFITLGQFLALLFEGRIETLTGLFNAFTEGFQLGSDIIVRHADVKPLMRVNAIQVGTINLAALGQFLRTAVGNFADDQACHAFEGIALNNTQLVSQIQFVVTQLVIDDRLGALVTLDAFTGKDLNVDHGARDAGRDAQTGVLYVRGFFTKDGAQQLFFRRQLGLTLRRHLADEDITGFDFGTDIDDTRLIQTRQLRLAQRRNIAADFFRSQLGIASNHSQLFDVHRGETIFGHHALGNENRVFVVVTVPRHERDEHVLTQGEFAQIGRCTIGHHITLGQLVADTDDRTLVDVGVLVRTGVLDQVVDIDTDFTGQCFVIVDTDHDTTGIHIIDHATTTRHNRRTRVNRHGTFDARTDHRFFRAQARYSLTLHVGTHQGAVGVIMLEEGHQRCRNRHDLRRCHVHVLNSRCRLKQGFALVTAGDQLIGQLAGLIDFGVGLGDDVLTFFNRRQVIDFSSNATIDHFTIRRFDEAIFVHAGIQCQRVDQADVRAFRRFDRAHTTVVGR